MDLREFVDQVNGFDETLPGEKIRLFAWFLHSHRAQDYFKSADIRSCFDKLHIPAPNIAMYLTRMTEARPPKVLREGNNYKLTRAGRGDLDSKYSAHQTYVQVSNILNELPGKISDISERSFLTEAIRCYQAGAFRACVVMTWNLAYSHLLNWILSDPARLARFNTAITTRYPKKVGAKVCNYDDFTDAFKESEVIEICNTASILNGNIIKILREKLGKRNTAAHPSAVTVVQSQADDVVTDLINNLVVPLGGKYRAG